MPPFRQTTNTGTILILYDRADSVVTPDQVRSAGAAVAVIDLGVTVPCRVGLRSVDGDKS